MKKFLLLFLFFWTIKNSVAQSVGIGTTSPNASAMLDVRSTSKGAVLPRMTSTQRKAIANPTAGLMVYDNSTASYWYYGNGGWKEFDTGVTNSDSLLTAGAITSAINSYQFGSTVLFAADSSGYFYDSGGPNANYGNNEDYTFSIYPNGEAVQLRLQVISLQTESPYDSLIIYHYNADTVSILTGNLSQQIILSDNRDVTLKFRSNNVNTAAGFAIRWDWVYVKNSTSNSIVPNNGWHYIPEKFAVAGGINTNNNWHKDSAGMYSFSYGLNNEAKGLKSISIGSYNKSNGTYATAIGEKNKIGGYSSLALGTSNSIGEGYNNIAIGTDNIFHNGYSSMLAIGSNNLLNGPGSKTIGALNTSSGDNSMVIGVNSSASGTVSFAAGYYVNASGRVSTAMGYASTAAGYASTALGDSVYALGYASLATGYKTYAFGNFSTAMGYSSYARGTSATAIGYAATALGNYATCIGNQSGASGDNATAIGVGCTASGVLSTAIGYRVNTNNHRGAFFFGDSDPNNIGVRSINTDNQFAARFNGGYYFITSDAGTDIGVRCPAGQNSWSSISDRNRKENFEPVNGEDCLLKIAAMPLSSWNYKVQDPKLFRHYGPMAQDFFAAFGKDKYGTIGCDTLINQQDFLGVNLVAIQALEKRTQKIMQLQEENVVLNKRLTELSALVEELKDMIKKIRK